MLEADEVMKWVAGLVTHATIVVVENTMEALLATYRPNLVTPLSFVSSFRSEPSILLVFIGHAFICLPIPPPSPWGH